MLFFFFKQLSILAIYFLLSKKKKIRLKKHDDDYYDSIEYESDEEYDDIVSNMIWFDRPYRKPGDVRIGSVRVGMPPLSVMHIKEDPLYPFFLIVDSIRLKRTRIKSSVAFKLLLNYSQKLNKFKNKTWALRHFLISTQVPLFPYFLDQIDYLIKSADKKNLNFISFKNEQKIADEDLICFFLKLPFKDFFEDISIKRSVHFYNCLFLINSQYPTIILKMWHSCLLAPKHDILYYISDCLLFLANKHVMLFWVSRSSNQIVATQAYWIIYYLHEILLYDDPDFDFDQIYQFSLDQKIDLEILNVVNGDVSKNQNVFSQDIYSLFKLLQTTNQTVNTVLKIQRYLFNKEDLLIRKKIQKTSFTFIENDSQHNYLYYFGEDISFFYNKHSNYKIFKNLFFKINFSQFLFNLNFFLLKFNLTLIDKNFLYTSFLIKKFNHNIEPHHKVNRFYYWFNYFYGYELKSLYSWFWNSYVSFVQLNDLSFFQSAKTEFRTNVTNLDVDILNNWSPLLIFKKNVKK